MSRRGTRIETPKVCIIWFISIGSPESFKFTRLCIDNDDPFIAVTICDVDFIFKRVDKDLGNPAEVFIVEAAGTRSRAPYLFKKSSVAGELENVCIISAIAADPQVAMLVKCEAMVRFWPFISLTWATP